MNKYFVTVIVLISLSIIADKPRAEEIRVPKDFRFIQDAINSSSDGDVISVEPGTYRENIYLPNKDIILRSTNGHDRTIIDGGAKGSVLTFFSGASHALIVDGFTITNGKAVSGGGIYLENSSPTIQNCVIINNTARDGGGVFCLNSSSPAIIDSTITDNSAKKGAGIFCLYSSSPVVTNSTINSNYASYGGGIFTMGSSSPVITKSSINENIADLFGDWILYFNSSPVITECSINGSVTDYGDGLYSYFLHFKQILKSDSHLVGAFMDFSWYLAIFELLLLKICIFISLKDTNIEGLIEIFEDHYENIEERYRFKEHSTSIHEYLKNCV